MSIFPICSVCAFIASLFNADLTLLTTILNKFLQPEYSTIIVETILNCLQEMIQAKMNGEDYDVNQAVHQGVKELFGKDTIGEISPKIKIHNTTETIEMEDKPTVAIKHKKDSSMVVGFKMLKEGEGDVFISAGNSGALLTGATLLVGRIKGIDRPALAGIMPAYKSQLLLIDAGSNTNCKPINLLQ